MKTSSFLYVFKRKKEGLHKTGLVIFRWHIVFWLTYCTKPLLVTKVFDPSSPSVRPKDAASLEVYTPRHASSPRLELCNVSCHDKHGLRSWFSTGVYKLVLDTIGCTLNSESLGLEDTRIRSRSGVESHVCACGQQTKSLK